MKVGDREPSDEVLAITAQQGSRESFQELVRRLQTPVLHFLQHRGAAADAEDLTQETFLRAYTHLDRYQNRWRFVTWLFTIARRVALNHQRSLRRADAEAVLEDVIAQGPGPGELAAEREEHYRLWDLARQVLSEEEHTALWLYYVEGLSTREIGTVLDRRGLTIKTMLFRARRKLLPLVETGEEGWTIAGHRPEAADDQRDFGEVEVSHET